MEYDMDVDKVDEVVLALLYLNLHERGGVVRAWKSLNWCSMNRLYEQGYIDDPRSKNLSVAMTEKGQRRAEELFKRHFSD